MSRGVYLNNFAGIQAPAEIHDPSANRPQQFRNLNQNLSLTECFRDLLWSYFQPDGAIKKKNIMIHN